jgi:hypothetical protein
MNTLKYHVYIHLKIRVYKNAFALVQQYIWIIINFLIRLYFKTNLDNLTTE